MQAGVGDDEGDALHRPVEPAAGDGPADRRCVDRVAVDELLERLTMVVLHRLEDGGQLVVGRALERTVEQAEGLETGLHLVHGPRRYRRTHA